MKRQEFGDAAGGLRRQPLEDVTHGRDAILDRVVHASHKIELKATKSMRDTAQEAAS